MQKYKNILYLKKIFATNVRFLAKAGGIENAYSPDSAFPFGCEIPFGLPHIPKTTHTAEPHTQTKKTNLDRPNGTSASQGQEVT